VSAAVAIPQHAQSIEISVRQRKRSGMLLTLQ
jgi:hypothetical protein